MKKIDALIESYHLLAWKKIADTKAGGELRVHGTDPSATRDS
jgi:hypothetical protein